FLRTQEDRLSREVVDEFLRRGERILLPLTDLCRDERSWKQTDALYWTRIHAAFILGATGDERAVKGLLAALRWSARYDVDWVYRAMPSMLGAVGRAALGALMARERRWQEKAEDDRWAAGVETGATWVHDRSDRLLRQYEASLAGLDDAARGNALWVAESMAEYNVWHENLAPWRWNGQTTYAYM